MPRVTAQFLVLDVLSGRNGVTLKALNGLFDTFHAIQPFADSWIQNFRGFTSSRSDARQSAPEEIPQNQHYPRVGRNGVTPHWHWCLQSSRPEPKTKLATSLSRQPSRRLRQASESVETARRRLRPAAESVETAKPTSATCKGPGIPRPCLGVVRGRRLH